MNAKKNNTELCPEKWKESRINTIVEYTSGVIQDY